MQSQVGNPEGPEKPNKKKYDPRYVQYRSHDVTEKDDQIMYCNAMVHDVHKSMSLFTHKCISKM